MPKPTGTGVVDYNSELVRKRWVREGLIQKAATSFWAPYKGKTRDSIIMNVNDISASQGHNVIFDMDGKLVGKPVKGKQQAVGTGEQKKKFSDSVTVDIYRWVVDNGHKFDGVNIGDLSINEHADSRAKLADLYTRSMDQAYFDLGQQTSEFGVTISNSFTFDDFLELEQIAKTGKGFTTNKDGFTSRAPIEPFRTQSGEPIWLLVIDISTKKALLGEDGMQNLLSNIDVRGNQNRLFTGIIGKIGNFVIVEGPTFFGNTYGASVLNDYYQYQNNSIYAAGLRQYILNTTDNSKLWTGEDGFEDFTLTTNHKLVSRNLLLGAGAFQFAMGKEPDYKFEDHDFGAHSESCLEVWCGAKPSKYLAENEDYDAVKISGYNYGCVFVDFEVEIGTATPTAAATTNTTTDTTANATTADTTAADAGTTDTTAATTA